MFSKLSGWYRLLVMVSIFWVVSWFFSSLHSRNITKNNMYEAWSFAILPIIFLWGVIWIVKGFKREKEKARLERQLQEKVEGNSRKIYCPICGSIFPMANGKPNSDGIIICPKCLKILGI